MDDISLIVTHINPDLDAVTSVWLLKRFDPQNFDSASLYFVPAGQRIAAEVLSDKNLTAQQVVHVDTGLGKFDHHTERLAQQKVCAASLVLDYLIERFPDKSKDQALRRLVDFVVDIDHFGEFYWPEPNADRYLFNLVEILHHLKTIGESDADVVYFGSKALDSIYAAFGSRIAAEAELKSGQEFQTAWGSGIGLSTQNDEVIKFAQKAGYKVVVRKDPEVGNIRIKAVPDPSIDLTPIYEKIIARDTQATWYFHPAKTMILNGSNKHQHQTPSQLSLADVVGIFATHYQSQHDQS